MKLFRPSNNNEITTLCLYHRVDMDGKCSGAIVNYLYKHVNKNSNIWFIGCNYEKDFSIDTILETFPNLKAMYIVDYSIDPNDAIKVCSKGIDVVWCDHHKTAIEKYENHPGFKEDTALNEEDENIKSFCLNDKNIPSVFWGVTSYKYSGAKLVYKSLYPTLKLTVNPGILSTMEVVSNLVSIYDTWDHSDTEKWDLAYAFNNATRLYNLNPIEEKWDEIFEDIEVVKTMLEEGNIVIRLTTLQNKITADAYSGTLEWEGLKFCTINRLGNSNLVNSTFNPEIHDAVLMFMYSPREGLYKVSMYSNDKLSEEAKAKLDLSSIALKYGGGGHKLACGFSCYDLPFNIHDIKPLVK